MAADEMTEEPSQTRQLDPAVLEQIVARLVAAYDPVVVILFGSHAEGDPTPASDLDLLVVTEVALDPREQRERRLGLYRYTHIPLQIITLSQETFEATRGVVGGIAYPAVKYGKVVYERP